MITLFPSRCYNGGKQHRFQPRATVKTICVPMPHGEISSYVALVLAERTDRIETYHGDVCQWCGATVNVPSSKPNKET